MKIHYYKYPLISIIIVNFNQKLLTLDCLKSVNSVTYPKYEVILVDNNSQDNSISYISKKFPKLKIIKNSANLGFAGGNNIGLQEANGEYILLLNNDTIVTPDFIQPLVEDMQKDEKLGVVQSKIRVMDNPKLLDSVASFQTITGFLYHKGYLDFDRYYNDFLYSFSAKGACILVRCEILKIGLFDEQYFAYFEETDLCWRAWLMGYKVAFEPRSVIYHKMGATSTNMSRAFMHYHSFKNRLRTIIKNASVTTIFWMLPLHVNICIMLGIYFVIIGEIEASKSVFKALWWNIMKLRETFTLRGKVQSLRKVSDHEIFSKTLFNPAPSFYLRHLSLVRSSLSNDR